MVLSAIFPGKIICIEPVIENRKFIEINLAKNNIKNVEILPCALCLKDEILTFYKNDESVSGSLFNYEHAVPMEVQGMSVDSLLAKNPEIAFVKFDCEGGEYDLVPRFLEIGSKIKYFTGEVHKMRKDRGFGQTKDVKFLRRAFSEKGFCVSTKPEQHGRRGLACMFAERSA